MEDQIEKEKMNIKRKFEKERKKILQMTEVEEEEKQKLMEDLKGKEETANKEKSKQ